MKNARAAGRLLLGLGVSGFGVLHLVDAATGEGLGSPWTPVPHWLLAIVGIVLLAGGGALIADKFVRPTAYALLGLMTLRVLIYFVPMMIFTPRNPQAWTPSFELLSIASFCLLLASDRLLIVTRLVLALALDIFAMQHMIYGDFVAMMIPAWLPGRLFVAWFVGAAFFAASMAIAKGGRAGWAAAWSLATMFFIWIVIMHGPRVAHAIHNGQEWTGFFVCFSFGSGALLLADRFSATQP